MLETVREFGAERLDASGEGATARDDHASFFAALAAAARPHLTGVDQGIWLERLEAEHDNLRAALDWLVDRRDAGRALTLAADLSMFWLLRNHLAEGRRRLAAVIEPAGDAAPAEIRVRALTGAGALAEAQGDDAEAASFLDAAVEMARRLNRPDMLAPALLFRGVVAFDLNDRPTATTCCRESLELAEATGDVWCAGVNLAQLGLVSVREHAYDQANEELRRSVERFRSLGNRWGIAVATGGLGILALDRGQPDKAAALLAESLTLFQAQGDRWGVAAYLEGAARAAAARRQLEEAARLFGAATGLRATVGITVKPVYRFTYERNVASVRAALGESAFESAWREGQGMTFAQAVATAVRAAESEVAPPTRPAGAKATPPPHGISLTPREQEVLVLLAEGLTDREIGGALFVGHRTVATHVTNILNKLGVNSRTAAASTAVRLGLV